MHDTKKIVLYIEPEFPVPYERGKLGKGYKWVPVKETAETITYKMVRSEDAPRLAIT